MANDPSYTISDSKDIIRNLTLVWKNKCLLTANFGVHESFITTIINVDAKKNSLVLDYGPKEYLNKKLLSSPNVTFEAEFSGIKTIIPGNKVSKGHEDEQAVFQLPIPETIIWQQRRKFYRVHSPLFNPASCLFTVDKENEVNIQLDLHDISLSGMALVYDDLKLSETLVSKVKFKNCKLTLPDIGEGIVSFTIRNEAPLNREKPKKTKKIGCEFSDVKPAFESALQRYIQTVERENKKKT